MPNLDQSSAGSQWQTLIRTSLDKLPPAQRDILELAYFSGLRCQEIANRCGHTLEEVKINLRCGLLKFSELMKSAPATSS